MRYPSIGGSFNERKERDDQNGGREQGQYRFECRH